MQNNNLSVSSRNPRNTYVVKESKTGHKIPVINDVHLHSVYNPIKEAQSFVKNYEDVLSKNTQVLVLGLGFGYHINAILDRLKDQGQSVRVSIIEPNELIIHDCLKYGLVDLEQVDIYTGDISELYHNEELVKILLTRPAVINHTASYNLNIEYFKNFLTYRAPNDIESLSQSIKNQTMLQYFNKINPEIKFDEHIKRLKNQTRPFDDQTDFLILALSTIKNGAQIEV